MGKTISVWSSTCKTGKTVFIYFLTMQLEKILDKSINILTCSLDPDHSSLADMLDIDTDEMSLENLINYRVHQYKNEPILKHFLAGKGNVYTVSATRADDIFYSRNKEAYEHFLDEFRLEFDLVLFDTVSGSSNPLSNMILERSDHVVNMVVQDKESLDKYRFKTGKDITYIINMYRDIYPSEKEIASSYGLKTIFALPYSKQLQDMKNRGKLDLYAQHTDEYMTRIKDIAYFLSDRLDLQKDKTSHTVNRRKGIFKKLKGEVK